ncbi:hypothetical protein [Magnetofaba australis]|uniref:STAS domain-containing protein n=1 Tax=Magnetofaba australis IT-1 TaxID=1434232 RepID=A0A1Y2K163_9PROT|nr:hypothetical protein [Magnetofaba australis]OSM01780.1 hypothetical protein MAIT1_01818 [Magnetofaba australis IT-1]
MRNTDSDALSLDILAHETILTIHDKLSLRDVSALKAVCARIPEETSVCIRLDLEHLDSFTIGMLLKIRELTGSRGQEITLDPSQDKHREALIPTGINQLFTIL